jgi:predicted nucleic acid-binding protein
MPIVTNTSPAIILARIGRLQVLKELYGTVFMSPSVKAECIDRGKEAGARDVLEIENGISQGWIQLVDLTEEEARKASKLKDEARIGPGEAEALVLAKSRSALAGLDDKEARAIAKSWNLDYTSTLMVLYEAFVKGLIDYDELVEDLAKVTRIMWISTDVITEIIRRAKEVKK